MSGAGGFKAATREFMVFHSDRGWKRGAVKQHLPPTVFYLTTIFFCANMKRQKILRLRNPSNQSSPPRLRVRCPLRHLAKHLFVHISQTPEGLADHKYSLTCQWQSFLHRNYNTLVRAFHQLKHSLVAHEGHYGICACCAIVGNSTPAAAVFTCNT